MTGSFEKHLKILILYAVRQTILQIISKQESTNKHITKLTFKNHCEGYNTSLNCFNYTRPDGFKDKISSEGEKVSIDIKSNSRILFLKINGNKVDDEIRITDLIGKLFFYQMKQDR